MYPSKSTCSIDLCEDVCSQSVILMILFLKKKFLPGTFFSSTYMVPILLLMTTMNEFLVNTVHVGKLKNPDYEKIPHSRLTILIAITQH